MVWVSLFAVLVIIAIQSRMLLKKRHWSDLFANLIILAIGVGLSTLVSGFAWVYLDPLTPVKAVFTPISNWIYGLF